MTVSVDFWRGKKVFLTGHTGFKGSWLSLWLQQMGAEVTGYALAPEGEQNMFTMARVAGGMESTYGDIQDLGALSASLHAARPDIVIHMAAQALVRYSYKNPVETYGTNVMGLVNLFEAVRGCPSVRAVVNVTSDKCYENQEREAGYKENEPMGGFDPYSNSKGCAELVTSAYRNSFFNPSEYASHGVALASARAGNVIGGGDWSEDRLIPDLMRSIIQGKPVKIRSPHAIRPWQHVLEPLSGYLLLAERLYAGDLEFCEGWNFGPSDEDALEVQWIVDQLTKSWGEGSSWELDADQGPHEAQYLRLDCEKANRVLNWHPTWMLSMSLNNIVSWYRAYITGKDMREVSLQQIKNFVQEGSTE